MKKILIFIILITIAAYSFAIDFTFTHPSPFGNVYTYDAQEVSYELTPQALVLSLPDFTVSFDDSFTGLASSSYELLESFFSTEPGSGIRSQAIYSHGIYITLTQSPVSNWVQIKTQDYTLRINWLTMQDLLVGVLEEII